MKINLTEIPDEGQTWEFETGSKKLPHELMGILEGHPFELEITLRPMSPGFQVSGQAKYTSRDLCSKCGYDIDLPRFFKIREILLPKGEFTRADEKFTTGNHSMDYLADNPEVSYFDQPQFDLGGYLYEIVQGQAITYPSCEDSNCKNLKEVMSHMDQDEDLQPRNSEGGHPAFEALKGIKLKGSDQD